MKLQPLLKTSLLLGIIMFTGHSVYADNQASEHPKQANFQEMRKSGNFPILKKQLQKRFELNDEQIQEIKTLQKSGDREAVKAKLTEFGVTPKLMNNTENHMKSDLKNQLTEDQMIQLKTLRDTGDFEAVHKQLTDWGIVLPEKKALEEILEPEDFLKMQDAKELIESGDIDAGKQIIKDINREYKEELPKKIGFFSRMRNFFSGNK